MAQRPIACNAADPYHSGDERYPPKGALSRGGSAHEHSLRTGSGRIRRRRGPLHLHHCPRGAAGNLKLGRRAGRVAVALSDGTTTSPLLHPIRTRQSRLKHQRSVVPVPPQVRPTSAQPTLRGQQASRALVMNSSKPTRPLRARTSPPAGPRSETRELLRCDPLRFVRVPTSANEQRASNSLGRPRVGRSFDFPRPSGVTTQLPTARRTLKVDAAVGR